MKRMLSTLIVVLTAISLGGCFPVFIPVGGHHHDRDYDRHYDRGYQRGW